MNIRNILRVGIIISLIVFLGIPTMSQEDGNSSVQDKGAWLLSKTEPDLKKIEQMLNLLFSKNIIPQAIDRNIAGELLIISQVSPPALSATQWYLGVYQSEKELMADLETQAKLGWTPTGMDVQDDAAFMLYVQTDEILTGARLVKLEELSKISSTIKTYYKLGYFPNSISTFQKTLWILFTKNYKSDKKLKSDIIIRAVDKDKTGIILSEELSKKAVSLIDVTFTVDDKVLMLFHNKQTN